MAEIRGRPMKRRISPASKNPRVLDHDATRWWRVWWQFADLGGRCTSEIALAWTGPGRLGIGG